MSPTDTTLVIVDAKAQHHAGLAKAALLAQKYGTHLELFAGGGASSSSALEVLALPLRDRGLDVATVTVVSDSLSAALAQRLRDPSTRFVIKDVAQSASSSQAELTHIDWQLVRTCPAPLLLSKPRLWSGLPLICAAVDPWHEEDEFESADGLIMAEGAMLAELMEGELHVLHAYIPPTFVVAAPAAAEVRAIELAQGLMSVPANARLRELRSFTSGYQLPVRRVHLLIGSVREALTGFVTQLRGDVVVMGAVSRASLREDVIGSTAEGLLKRIPCDVLVVKEPQAAMSLH